MRTASKGIGLSALFTGSVTDEEVKLGKELAPSYLASRQLLSSHKIFQVAMVREDSDREGGSFKFWAPVLKASNYSKEFLVIDFVVTFSFAMFPGHKRYRVEDTCIVFLREDA